MPTFENIEVNTTIDVDFEVFCGTCGKGLCSESDTRNSRNRNYLQVTVNACPDCIQEKQDEIYELKLQIEDLEREINDLNNK